MIKDHPFLTQYEMADAMKVLDPELNTKIERSVVLRLLKAGGFSKKRLKYQDPSRNLAENVVLRC